LNVALVAIKKGRLLKKAFYKWYTSNLISGFLSPDIGAGEPYDLKQMKRRYSLDIIS
jgi:hypothetical protein